MISMQVIFSRCRVNFYKNTVSKRFRSRKEKHAIKAVVKSNSELALKHYDMHLGNIYSQRWPSMRLALLSQPKYCAVMNNFCADQDTFLFELAEKGGFNFISRFNENDSSKFSLVKEEVDDDLKKEETENKVEKDKNEGRVIGTKISMTSSASDLLSFVSGDRVLSNREALMHSEHQLHNPSFQPQTSNPFESTDPLTPAIEDNKEVTIKTSDEFQYHHKLQAILHSKGDLTHFQPARRDSQTGKLSYYLMDAGSILPVLALDLFPGCSVLDMCSAPGGKTFAMLQTMLPGLVVCLDKSHSRIVRLKNTIKSFFPHSYTNEGADSRVEVKTRDAFIYTNNNTQQFDRVLVDVPCYSDRHSLTDIENEDNNLFKSSRQQDRISIQALQQQLLIGALNACKVGGIVVYSTCTLLPSQNDVVVRMAVQEAMQDLNIEVDVVDTGKLAEAYEDFFCFEEKWEGKLGQLVVPNMVANFGPTYFSKLRRTA